MLTRFFSGSISFRRDDAIKIILLFVIHLLYFVGLRWIDNASYSLFLENWGAAELSSMFVASAVLIVIFGTVYGFLAARVSHEKLLTVLALGIIAWLASVEILQRTPGFAGQRGIVYPYFFLLTGVLGDIGAAHILIYLSEFYDTRAAKRALPVLVSASIAGAIIAGALAPTLKTKLGLDNLPLATIACLLFLLVCVYALRILVPNEIELAEQRVRSALVNWQKNPAHGNLRFLRELGIVRWLVLSTFVLVVLMKLLTFQSGLIFEAQYKGNPGALFDFYSAIDVYASIAGLIFSSLIFGPMIVRFGIGKMNMLFPLITLGAIGALNLSPNLSTAVLGRVNDRVLKKVFRNPLDAMLLNSVPTRVKARARNFVNGASNSLGTLATGLLTLAIAARDLTPNQVIGVSLLLAVVYIFSAWRLRAEYSRALEKTIAENELDVFRAGLDEYEQTDPATIDRLEQRLRTSTEDGLTVVFADLYYEFKGQEAIPLFCEIASKRSVAVRAAIIQLIGEDAIHLAQVQELCLTGLRDPDKSVRTAAARSLLHLPRLAQNENILNAFAETLSQLDEETQEKMVPHMIASNDFYFEMPAIYVLYGWLSDTKIAERRARGLRVLATTGDSKLIGRLSRFLHDRESIVRMQALDLISQLAAHARDRKVRLIGFDTLRNGLKDHDASVRANAVENLQYFEYKLIAPALITAMSDSNFNVRRQACAVTRKIPPDLKRALTGDDPYLAECAAYTLSRARRVRLGKSRAQKRALELCGKILRDIYTLETYRLALESVTAPGARVLDANLEEQTGYLLDRLFWLVSALSDDQAAESVRTALSSPVEQTHINAVETFETITTPRLAKMIAPLYENKSLAALAGIGKVEFGLSAPPFDRVSEFLWPQLETIPAAPNAPQATPIENADWLAATTIRTLQDLIPARGDDSNQTSQLELPPLEKFRDALEAAAEDERAPLTQEAAHGALRRLESRKNKSRAPTALSVIEKVIALKQVPFFQAMSTEDLRLLAYICDEIRATPNQTIITHGELSDTLYVIVSGKLAVQRTSDGKVGQIAELGVNEFFGELALFDQQPGSADVIALTPTVLLAIRHAPLITMIRNQPDLAINLFQVLTQRLRRLNALISDNDIRARSD